MVVRWLKICLPMPGTQVQSLVWEDSMCLGAAKLRHLSTEPALPTVEARFLKPWTTREVPSFGFSSSLSDIRTCCLFTYW